MKKLLLFTLLVVSISAAGQPDTSSLQLLQQSYSTAIGAFDGVVSSKKVGVPGGKISSEDGRIELFFPAGALTAPTDISIQPTTNPAPNGAGKSYWFEPSGITFKKPVQIIFHYTDEEAAICPPDLMGLAIQSKNGKWTFVNYDDWDSTSRTLKGFIHHFSGASNVYMMRLQPAKRRICVREQVRINIWEFFSKFDVSIEPYFRQGQKNYWYVNDTHMGSKVLGYLSVYEETDKVAHTMVSHATYIAPDYLIPEGNPVTVSVDIKILSGKRKGQLRRISCSILVYDVYKVTVIHTMEFRVAMGNEITDSASFYVWLHPQNMSLTNIQNYPPAISKRGRARAGCIMNISTSSSEGWINLTDAYAGYSKSKDYPPEIFFNFLPSVQKKLFSFQWICPGVTTEMTPLYEIPLSPEINFIANRTVQKMNSQTLGKSYKVIVTPYNP